MQFILSKHEKALYNSLCLYLNHFLLFVSNKQKNIVNFETRSHLAQFSNLSNHVTFKYISEINY